MDVCAIILYSGSAEVYYRLEVLGLSHTTEGNAGSACAERLESPINLLATFPRLSRFWGLTIRFLNHGTTVRSLTNARIWRLYWVYISAMAPLSALPRPCLHAGEATDPADPSTRMFRRHDGICLSMRFSCTAASPLYKTTLRS